MVLSTALLKTPRILSLLQPQRNSMPPLRLIWRRNLLLVERAYNLLPDSVPNANGQNAIPALQNLEWCEACLYRSPIKAVRLGMDLGEETLRRWADACDHAGKRAYVHLPSAAHLPKSHSPHTWRLKRIADWIAATLLLLC